MRKLHKLEMHDKKGRKWLGFVLANAYKDSYDTSRAYSIHQCNIFEKVSEISDVQM